MNTSIFGVRQLVTNGETTLENKLFDVIIPTVIEHRLGNVGDHSVGPFGFFCVRGSTAPDATRWLEWNVDCNSTYHFSSERYL